MHVVFGFSLGELYEVPYALKLILSKIDRSRHAKTKSGIEFC